MFCLAEQGFGTTKTQTCFPKKCTANGFLFLSLAKCVFTTSMHRGISYFTGYDVRLSNMLLLPAQSVPLSLQDFSSAIYLSLPCWNKLSSHEVWNAGYGLYRSACTYTSAKYLCKGNTPRKWIHLFVREANFLSSQDAFLLH